MERRVLFAVFLSFLVLYVYKEYYAGPPTPHTAAATAGAVQSSLPSSAPAAVDFGWGRLIAEPLYTFFKLIEARVHDIGVSVVLFALAIYFAYAFVTYGIRRTTKNAFGQYQQELAWANAAYASNRELLAQQHAGILSRHVGAFVRVFVLYAVKAIFLLALYYVFISPPEFRNLQTSIRLTDLSSPPRGFVLLGAAALSVAMQSLLQLALPIGSRLFASMIPALMVGAVAYFMPSGLVVVLTTMTAADVIQTAYEKGRPESWFGSLVPAVVVIPLALAYIPRAIVTPVPTQVATRETPQEQQGAAPSSAPPSRRVAAAPSKIETSPPTTDLAARVLDLRQKRAFKDAVDLIDAQLAITPTNTQLRDLKVIALTDLAAQQIEDGHRLAASQTLAEARRIDPSLKRVANMMADILLEAGQEELRGVNVRKEPSDMASVAGLAKVGDSLTRRSTQERAAGWLPVTTVGGAPGWIRESLVDDSGSAAAVLVKATPSREEAFKTLDAAVESSTTVRNRVLWLKYKTLLVPAGILLVVCYVGWRKFAGL